MYDKGKSAEKSENVLGHRYLLLLQTEIDLQGLQLSFGGRQLQLRFVQLPLRLLSVVDSHGEAALQCLDVPLTF